MESFPSHVPFKDVRPQATLNKAIPMLFITGDVQVINVCVLTWRVGTRPFGVASGRVEMEELVEFHRKHGGCRELIYTHWDMGPKNWDMG